MESYEKKYKDALSLAKSYYSNGTNEFLDTIFPELTESEDERIRKELLHYIQGDIDTYDNMVSGDYDSRDEEDKKVHSMLKRAKAYLEKQKEQKPNVELIQRSWYMEGYHDREFGKEPKWIIKIGEGGPKHELNPRYGQLLADKQKSVEWSEDFEENIRNLLQDKLTGHSKDGTMTWTTLIDDKTLKDIVNGIWFYVGKEALKYPNKELDVTEWSEEDERIRLACIATINDVIDYERDRWEDYNPGKPYRPITKYDEQIDWLKSLRPQPKRRDTYYDIIHNILAMLKDMDFTQITPEHRVFLLNDIRVKCKNADECAEILDEPSWKPSKEQL